MCNLYSLTRAQDAMRRLFKVERDTAGNLPPLPDIFPDQLAPVVRTAKDGVRELGMMRWGFPPPPNAGRRPISNIRNLGSAYWRGWLQPWSRCLVPLTSFCEYTDSSPKVPHWFALDESRPLLAFAGIWRPWRGVRGPAKAPVEGEHRLFAFLTCEANEVVGRVHAQAMPVLLSTEPEFETWLRAPVEQALALQRSFPSDRLFVVATGEKQDFSPDAVS